MLASAFCRKIVWCLTHSGKSSFISGKRVFIRGQNVSWVYVFKGKKIQDFIKHVKIWNCKWNANNNYLECNTNFLHINMPVIKQICYGISPPCCEALVIKTKLKIAQERNFHMLLFRCLLKHRIYLFDLLLTIQTLLCLSESCISFFLMWRWNIWIKTVLAYYTIYPQRLVFTQAVKVSLM